MSLFYNYNKEGRGVKKGGPQKRTFFVFFEVLFRNFWRLIPVNICYWVLSILPFGLGEVGITAVTRNLSRDKHTFGIADFFTAIKKNWKRALGVGFLNTLITLLLVFDVDIFFSFYRTGSWLGAIGLGISFFIFIVFTVMKFYIWFMVITFDIEIKHIYLNSFKFFVVNLKNNIIMLFSIMIYWIVITFLYVFLSNLAAAFLLLLITIVFYPSYQFLIIQFGIFKSIKKYMIDPYYEEHPDDDIENRRALGLDVPDSEESDFEDIV